MSSFKMLKKLSGIAFVSSSAAVLVGGYLYVNNDEKFFKSVLMPAIRLLDAETSHRWAVKACEVKLLPHVNFKDPESLSTSLLPNKLNVDNCIGISAGFDKNAEAIEGLSSIGFGFVEIGSVTPFAQGGNSKPRVFRLNEDSAIINRYGFNSDGHEKVWHRIQSLRANKNYEGIIGVNLGKNKSSDDAVKDYVDGLKLFAPVADYLVINVSSPNTPGLRLMQQKESLKLLLTEVVKANKSLDMPRPIFLKLSPDLTEQELLDICSTIQRKECKIEGLIVSNTTIDRAMLLESVHKDEAGGLSGRPLKEKSTRMVEDAYRLTNGKVAIIGVGGIANGQDAYEKILAGASAVQIYTSFAIEGPPVVTKIKKELDEILKQNGYSNVSEAVGKGDPSTRKRSWFSFH